MPRGLPLELRRFDLPGPGRPRSSHPTSAGRWSAAYVDGSGVLHGFLLGQGVLTIIDVPGAIATFPRASTIAATSTIAVELSASISNRGG